MATKIKYIQLEPAEVLLDFHTSRMTAEQFGCYWLIILNLYCNNGKLDCDVNELGMLCNYSENFEKIWEKIESKFQKTNGKIRHKRVSRELHRAKKFIQHRRSAGLSGAKKRWQAYGDPNGDAIAKKSKGNESEVKVRQVKETGGVQTQDSNPKTSETSGSGNTVFSSALSSITARSNPASGGILSQQLRFHEQLREIIRPRSESDLTCFHRLSQWLVKEITFKRFDEHIFRRVLDIARESATGSRNPAAVFMSRLKKELNYNIN